MNMNQNQNYNNQQMGVGQRFFYIWGPAIIHQIGLMVVELVALMALFSHRAAVDATVAGYLASNNIEKLYDLMVTLINKYGVLITGAGCLLLIPVFLLMYRKDRKHAQPIYHPLYKKASARTYLPMLVMVACLHYILNNLIVISNAAENVASYQSVSKMFYGPALAVQVLCLGVLAPICEELVYRGLIFRRLRSSGGYLNAALLSSLLFGVVHGNLVQMLYAFVLGMLLSFLYERFNTVLAPILAHAFLNLLSIALTAAKFYDYLAKNNVIVMVSTILVAGAAAALFLNMNKDKISYRSHKRQNDDE